MRKLCACLLILPVIAAPPLLSEASQIFRRDDPISIDHDDLPIPMPRPRNLSDAYDFVENTFFGAGDSMPRRAVNINTLGEVPDSSWYTNRLTVRNMTVEELIRGANAGSGPAPGPWTVIDLKTGRTPGFVITDSRRDTYFIKFDPAANPEMATAAEMITSRFMHALGYHVPEYYLVNIDPKNLTPGETLPLLPEGLDAVFANTPQNPDGTFRAIASKLLPGKDLGPFKFHGTRADDPNDIYPHEHRRELRGYYVVCSWLNHDDSRAINTLDMYIGEAPKGYVKHHLIDFGSTLGSATVIPQRPQGGNEHKLEFAPTLASIFSLGIWVRPWVSVKYPHRPSIGRFEAEFFRPDRWKPDYPNAAFRNMDAEDAFWAARQIMKFKDDDIRAVVRSGKLSGPTDEEYLVQVLIKRRDKIGNYWLRQVSSLDNFRIDAGALVFEDLRVTYRFENEMPPQIASFASLDNRTAERKEIRSELVVSKPHVDLPDEIVGSVKDSLFVVRLSSSADFTDVFLRQSDGGLKIVGIQRRDHFGGAASN